MNSNLSGIIFTYILVCATGMLGDEVLAQSWQSAIVFEGADGKLAYVSDQEGNRIPDFSHAGYRGGGVALPEYPVVMTISPIAGDNTIHIQDAIDAVSAMQPDGSGIRGALLLEAGVYTVSQQLRLRTSGVVIRGVGQEADSILNTIIKRIGTGTDAVLKIGSGENEDAWKEQPGTRTNITSAFVQVGSRSFHVADPHLLSIGDQIIITHPLTQTWIDAVDGGGTSDDPPWEPDDFDIAYTRIVENIQDSLVFIDAPVFNHLDRSLAQSYVYQRDNQGEIEEVGIENLRITIDTNGPLTEDHARTAVEFVHVANAWASHVTVLHFVYAGIDVRRSIHVTVNDSEALEPHSLIEGARRYNFAVYRSQLVLFRDNLATEGRHNYVGNGEAWDSGIVFLNNVSMGASNTSEPHRHWGQAFLYDNHLEMGSTTGQLRLRLANRGDFGTGHGWAAVHSVAWNCKMNRTRVSIEKPPTAQNYAIGCEGLVSGTGGSFNQPGGYIEGTNVPDIHPYSLYEKQLADRLGIPFVTSTTASTLTSSNNPLEVFPNPFADHTQIQINLANFKHILLEVYDVLGRRLVTLANSHYPAGIHQFSFDAESTPSGFYFVRLTTSNAGRRIVYHKKMVRVF